MATHTFSSPVTILSPHKQILVDNNCNTHCSQQHVNSLLTACSSSPSLSSSSSPSISLSLMRCLSIQDSNSTGILSLSSPINISSDFFMLVPVEIVVMILKSLPFKDLLSISQVNKELTSFASDGSIWKQFCISHIQEHAHCKLCKQGVVSAVHRRAAVDGIPWIKLFKDALISTKQAKWGPPWESHRVPNPMRSRSIEYMKGNTTVRNIHGGWNVVQFSQFPILPFGLYHFSFLVDHFSCNGMMVALATNQWHGVYPGSGNSGITQSNKTVAYYSHNPTVFSTGDLVCICLDVDKQIVTFHKNGEVVGSQDMPQINRSDGEEWCVVGAFCGNYHQLSVSYAHHTLLISCSRRL